MINEKQIKVLNFLNTVTFTPSDAYFHTPTTTLTLSIIQPHQLLSAPHQMYKDIIEIQLNPPPLTLLSPYDDSAAYFHAC